jgi:hypothetical protein
MIYYKQLAIVFAFIALSPTVVSAKMQTQHTADIRFLKAKIIEAIGQREVLVLFEVTTAEKKDFPPVLTNTVKYRLGGTGTEHIVRIGRGSNVRAMAYKNNVQEKSTLIYGYIKDMVEIRKDKDLMILAFYIRLEPDEEVETMSFSYTLAEKRNPKLKLEKKFDFPVEL